MIIQPINIEWNNYNGFIFCLFYLDAFGIDASLFGISLSPRFLFIDVLFFTITIFDKTGL